jgi:transposase
MATTSSKSERVEIITSMQRRRRWSPSEKQSMVQETYEPEVLKEAVRLGREKKLISRAPLRGVEDFE